MSDPETEFKELLLAFVVQRFHPEARVEYDGKKVSIKALIESLGSQILGSPDTSTRNNDAKYHFVINELLKRLETRQMLFRAWAKLASHLYLSGAQDSELQLGFALNWAATVFKAVGIYNPQNFFSRICVLAEARNIHSSRTVLDDNSIYNQPLEALLKFQSNLEYLIISLADMEIFHSKFMKSTFVTIDSNSILFVLYLLPMPKQENFSHVRRKLLTNIESDNQLVETISAITTFIQTLVDLLCNKIRIPSKVFELQASGGKLRLEAQIEHPVVEGNHLDTRREVESILETKLMWILDVLVEALGFSFRLHETDLVPLVNVVQDMTKLEILTLPAICSQIIEGLKSCCPTVPKLKIPDAVPAYIWRISQLTNHPHLDTSQRAIKVVQSWQMYSKQLPIAFEGIFLQVISNPDRLVLPSLMSSLESALDETLISSSAGAFEIDDMGIKWLGIPKEVNPTFAKLTNALAISFDKIATFSQGRVKNATNMPYSSRPVANMSKQPANSDVTAYYVRIKTKDKIEYRFYPFYDDKGEIFRLEDILSRRTGLAPITERKFVCNTLAKQLECIKAELNANYLQKYPPIEHSAELYSLIKRLTQENEAASIYAMERLYHSCRQESEVTKECLRNLRLVWYKASSETVWLKVLGIVDRILDPAVMTSGDMNFEIIISWMKSIEETVSPYKSAEALKIASILLARAKSMQNNIMPTVYRPQKTFDSVELAEKFAGLSFE